MYYLIIDLKSPVCIGSGAGGPGYIDRDVIVDPSGLPVIPARRLKGLLREAFTDVCNALDLDRRLEIDPFGEIGAEQGGELRIRNGLLCDSDQVAPDPGLAATLRAGRAIAMAGEVTAFFTEIRRQTSIDAASGVALKETFRSTRALKAGLRFASKLEFGNLNEAGWISLIALAAAALQRMGTSRSRGLGSVACSLYSDASNETEKALRELEQTRAVRSPAVTAKPAPPHPQDPVAQVRTQPLFQPLSMMRYRIQLSEPAVLAGLEGDPNLIATQHFVPGSTIQGLFARRYLSGGPAQGEFYRLFCRGDVRFLAAYPEGSNIPAGESMRLLPVPASLRVRKNKREAFLNLAADSTERHPAKRLTGAWTVPTAALFEGELRIARARTQFSYHHARPSTDRRIGRAVGVDRSAAYNLEPERSGAVFTYESLLAGQAFQGLLLGGAESLRAVSALISSGERVALGRSRTAQYGADAEWTWLDDRPREPGLNGGEFTSWQAEDPPAESPACGSVMLVLLSPMMGFDEVTGHPAPVLPLAEIRRRVGLPLAGVSRAFASVGWASSYLAHQGLARQQMPVLHPGSVFSVRLDSPSVIPSQDWTAAQRLLESQSFGLRTEQGFGRIALVPGLGQQAGGKVTLFETPQQEAGALSPSAARIFKAVRRDRIGKLAAASGMALADKTRNGARVSLSLLSRLRSEIRIGPFAELAQRLDGWRSHAKSQLDPLRIERALFWPGQAGEYPFDKLLAEFLRDRAAIVTRLSNQLPETMQLSRETLEPEAVDEYARLILESFVSSLQWKIRANRAEVKAR